MTPQDTQAGGSRAIQGHRYLHGETSVLALESGTSVQVAELVPNQPWLGRTYQARADWLVPQRMAYFHGEVPRG